MKTVKNAAFLMGLSIIPLVGYGQAPKAPEDKLDEKIERIVESAVGAAERWIERIETKGGAEANNNYMGVVIESVPDVLRDYIDLPKGVGLLLPQIIKEGPAAKAGLLANDILVEFDGQLIVNGRQLSTLIDLREPGDKVPIKVMRKGELMSFEIELIAHPKKTGQVMPPALDEILAGLDEEDFEAIAGELEGAVGEIEGVVGEFAEWLPGSVRVFVDENERVHVDLQDLREGVRDLQHKLRVIHTGGDSWADVEVEHGGAGARKTIIRMADKQLSYKGKEGEVLVIASGDQPKVLIWDADERLQYDGVQLDTWEAYPEAVQGIMRAFESTQRKMSERAEGANPEIRLDTEDVDPLTLRSSAVARGDAV